MSEVNFHAYDNLEQINVYLQYNALHPNSCDQLNHRLMFFRCFIVLEYFVKFPKKVL